MLGVEETCNVEQRTLCPVAVKAREIGSGMYNVNPLWQIMMLIMVVYGHSVSCRLRAATVKSAQFTISVINSPRRFFVFS